VCVKLKRERVAGPQSPQRTVATDILCPARGGGARSLGLSPRQRAEPGRLQQAPSRRRTRCRDVPGCLRARP
jgi:hypothetical protein